MQSNAFAQGKKTINRTEEAKKLAPARRINLVQRDIPVPQSMTSIESRADKLLHAALPFHLRSAKMSNVFAKLQGNQPRISGEVILDTARVGNMQKMEAND